MPKADDATIGYDVRDFLVPPIFLGGKFEIDYVPLYFATTAGITYTQSLFARTGGSGGLQTYVPSSAGNGSIRARTTGQNAKDYNISVQVLAGGGTDKADRLPLTDLDGVRISPGCRWWSQPLRHFEWNLSDDDEHDTLTFEVTTVSGAVTRGITASIDTIGSDQVLLVDYRNGVLVNRRIYVQAKASGVDVGDRMYVDLIPYTVTRQEGDSDNPGEVVPALPPAFQDPAASLAGIAKATLQDGFTDPNFTIVERNSGFLGQVEIDDDRISCDVTRRDDLTFPSKVLDRRAGRLWGHAERLSLQDTIGRWGTVTGETG